MEIKLFTLVFKSSEISIRIQYHLICFDFPLLERIEALGMNR